METIFDVIVVGYGPVGAMLANLLGHDGLSVAVVERMTRIYDKPRAINIDHEVMRLLQSVGLAAAVEPITSHHTGTDFRGADDRLIKVFDPLPPPYPLGWPPNLMFVQPEFEQLLRDGVARFPNVTVMLGTEAVSLEQDADEVRVRVTGGMMLRARTLVACDGGASPIRKALGITQDSLDFDESWTVLDAWLKPGAKVPVRTTQFCRPSGPTTYVVGPRNLRRWEMKLLPHESPADYDNLDTVRRRLRPFVDPDSIDIWRVATYRFHALVAHEWRRGRVLLAGDAAHQMPPFMAQGLCSGMRDVANLAWKLTAVLRDGWPDALLDSYTDERKPHIRQLVATTKALGLIIGELDPARARQRDEALGHEVATGASERVRQKLIPDLTDGLLARGPDGAVLPLAGMLSPQPHVTDHAGHLRRLDDVAGPDFLLLTLGAQPQTWVGEAEAAAWTKLGGQRLVLSDDGQTRPDAVAEQGTMLGDWMRQRDCAALLVRPDKYVFGTASESATLNDLIRQVARHAP